MKIWFPWSDLNSFVTRITTNFEQNEILTLLVDLVFEHLQIGKG